MTLDEANLLRRVAQGETAEAAGGRLMLAPGKVRRWCELWSKRGWYTYRGSPGVGWLTDAGREKAARV